MKNLQKKTYFLGFAASMAICAVAAISIALYISLPKHLSNSGKIIRSYKITKQESNGLEFSPQDPIYPFVTPKKLDPIVPTKSKVMMDAYVDIPGKEAEGRWPKLDNETLCRERREAVKQTFLDAWYAYRKYAWGADEIRPLTKSRNNWLGGQATTIIDSISTIFVMGLKDELEQAKEFVKGYSVYRGSSVSLFETAIRILAGLISSYDLTGETLFLRKAEEIGDVLISNFEYNKASSIPSNNIHLTKPSKEMPFNVRREAIQSELEHRVKVDLDHPDFFTPGWQDYNLSFMSQNSDEAQIEEELSKPSPDSQTYSIFNASNSSLNMSNSGVNETNGANVSNYGAYLAEFGLYLEFVALSDRTGDPHYAYHSLRAMQATLHAKRPNKGVVGQSMNLDGKSFASTTFSIGAMADSFYEYIIKESLYSMPYAIKMKGDEAQAKEDLKKFGSEEKELGEHWVDVMNAFMRNARSGPSGHRYIADNGFGRSWQHLSCFSGGNYALGAYYLNNWKKPVKRSLDGLNGEDLSNQERENNLADFLDLGADLAETCFLMYNQSKSGLSGEDVDMSQTLFGNSGDSKYIMRPEVVESLFYLYRITGDPKWQEKAWSIYQSIEKVSKLPHHVDDKGVSCPSGYTSISNVHSDNPSHLDDMPSFFMSETLKYLYLIFTDPSEVVPLDQWVFTTEAHPIARRKFLKRVVVPADDPKLA
ncbi:putative Alpha-mannosidase 1 [Monocercomonoides exilis]|uniref:putative Alpha-mannosidase 1 n=1 Tax=Monocercomonoides exilis TaxID=2049356 RepID=UPI00355A36E1|nr:putative Alpha-mannosidase 1 [Monocercomonoides exilis]|eukprot:MONOS_4248.1-p1 / transcript=MONOS_4248.1 / gene=MONOS_4248 / organism=Monocercomonoides_exilis_PA203 / gene_product=Alpha-mannosidase 1 isoform 2 / transcript_product=Alpha-mannosidase 1 isoform 2 / location=Mono_scaffold00110:103614-106029(-) / protein_length=705 / sequence_SO=supercontig / SO=protein_coding / is_pseudo=false